MDADVIIIGAGLAGLVAAHELTDAGRRVIVVDQENRNSLGGQAFWSFGGLFLVDSPEQRRLGVRDSLELARADWAGTAGFDRLGSGSGSGSANGRPGSGKGGDDAGDASSSANANDDAGGEDLWASRWADAYLDFAAGPKREYLRRHGIGLTPLVGWAERGGGLADGHGNSVPRFHIAWGTGTGVVGPFAESLLAAENHGSARYLTRHRVSELIVEGGAVVGVHGELLREDTSARAVATNRDVVGEFSLRAPAVIVATGGIGADHDLVRSLWPSRLGTPPGTMLSGIPAHVDGSGLRVAERAGAAWVNRDRMWHYTEGIANHSSVWPGHGIRILPGPSPLWFDALGRRLPAPHHPGYDTLATLAHLRSTPDLQEHDHSWFVLTQRMIEKEFALSGSEQNPDITSGDRLAVLRQRFTGRGAPGPVATFQRRGEDFLAARSLEDLVPRMNALAGADLLEVGALRRQIEARDLQVDQPFSKDSQIQGIRNARRYVGDRLMRVSSPHRVLDPEAGPLIAVRLRVLTRKSLGGLQTDLSSRVLRPDGAVLPGLWAVGEAAGFGGGGVHGYRSLEGTFLGGCLFTGLTAGREVSGELAA